MQPLKRGAGVLAMEMAASIISMVILGTEKIVPPDTLFRRRRGMAEVRFGPPLHFPPTQTHGEATRMIELAFRRLVVEETRGRGRRSRRATDHYHSLYENNPVGNGFGRLHLFEID